MTETPTAEKRKSLLGTHFLQDSGEEIRLGVLKDESGRWKAQLAGRAFCFSECFDELDQARNRVIEWFQRAFPLHVCNRQCKMQGFSRMAQSLQLLECRQVPIIPGEAELLSPDPVISLPNADYPQLIRSWPLPAGGSGNL